MRLRLDDAWRAVAAAGWNWYPAGHEFIRYAYKAWHELKYGRPDGKTVFPSAATPFTNWSRNFRSAPRWPWTPPGTPTAEAKR